MEIVKAPRAKALIFDLDGTLVDTVGLHYKAWKSICEPHGFTFSMDYFLTLTGLPVLDIAKQIIEDFNRKDLNAELLSEHKMEYYVEKISDIRTIKATVKFLLKYQGIIPVGLATGAGRDITELILDTCRLSQYFDAIVTADEVNKYKPEPDVFLECARQLNVDPSVCQAIEDGPRGLEAARRAGMIVTDVKPYYQI